MVRAQPKRDAKYYAIAVVASLAVLVLSPVLLVMGSVYLLQRWARGSLLKRRFRRTFGKLGKRAVFVYSDSPNWKGYIESQLLPQIGDRVVTLNWSLRSQWPHEAPLEVQIFRHWSGERSYNPMAIVVPRRGRVKTIRFWEAFRDFRHGRAALLEKRQSALLRAVGAAEQPIGAGEARL